jgi:Actin interacting protein 3
VLETCLAREASTDTLNKYLPDVRRIIINLLQGLKRKQATYRTRTAETEEDYAAKLRAQRPPMELPRIEDPSPTSPEPSVQVEPERQPSPTRKPAGSRSKRNLRSPPPEISRPPSRVSSPPTQTDALAKLQTSDALQRRASKRFSAYNFAKLDGIDGGEGRPGNIPPPPPVPGRHRPANGLPDQTRVIRPASPRKRSPARATPVPEEKEEVAPVPVTVFLHLGGETRKTSLSMGDCTIQSLRLLFVEKFQYNPGEDETFPEILATDRETGVRYTLERMGDITEGTTLTLDVQGTSLRVRADVVDSGLKKSFAEGISAILKEIGTLQHTVSAQQSLLSTLSDQNFTMKQELSTLKSSSLPRSTPPNTPTSLPPSVLKPTLVSLKQDLSSLKAEHLSLSTHISTTLSSLRSLPPPLQPSADTLSTQKHDLEQKTQELVTQSDDLSDQLDSLRIDILQKRIRPHPRVLASIKKHSTSVRAELSSAEAVLSAVKPVWKRVWQEELQRVIDGQEFLRHQETLLTDLSKDLADTEELLAHVVQAAELLETQRIPRREWLSGAVGSGGRDALLGEVKNVKTDSRDRVQAIERAEKARQRELGARRRNELQDELSEVVSKDRLRGLSLGAEKVERDREEKERRVREEIWRARKAEDEKEEKSTDEVKSEDSLRLGEEKAKRAASNGLISSSAGTDEAMSRSQSHSSGLARVKHVSVKPVKRYSADATRYDEDATNGDRNGVPVMIGVVETEGV